MSTSPFEEVKVPTSFVQHGDTVRFPEATIQYVHADDVIVVFPSGFKLSFGKTQMSQVGIEIIRRVRSTPTYDLAAMQAFYAMVVEGKIIERRSFEPSIVIQKRWSGTEFLKLDPLSPFESPSSWDSDDQKAKWRVVT